MSSDVVKALELETEKEIELCTKIIHAAEIIYDIYGEILMSNVLEEVLETENAPLDKVQDLYVKLTKNKIIQIAS